MKRLLAMLTVAALGMGLAQQVSPQRIIVNPNPTDLSVKTWVDKDPAKRGDVVYRLGETITIYAQVNQDAYVYLFNINAEGKIDLILPNAFDQDNFLRRNETRRYPPAGARYTFRIDPPEGLNRVLAIAAKRPIAISQIADVARGEVRVSGAENLGRALSIVVDPLPDRDWVSDLATFYVGRVTPNTITPVPSTATLEVTSNPSGAQVLIDGRLVGNTPLTFSTNPGRTEIQVRLAGYSTYETTVNLRQGETTRVQANLVSERRTGDLEVSSNPVGAEVFVNGTRAGVTPLRVTLNEGTYDVRVAANGYIDFRSNVQITRGTTSRVNATLTAVRRTGELQVTSNVNGAEVFINGSRAGVTPLRVTLDEGSYEVRVSSGGFGDFRTTARVEQGRTVSISAVLAALRATLEINTNVEVRVFIDGTEVGQTRNGVLSLQVDSGNREITLVAPGYRTVITTVRLDPGEREVVRINLSRL